MSAGSGTGKRAWHPAGRQMGEAGMNLAVSSDSETVVLVTVVWAVFVTIFWMIVGWRAMRAHEKLVDVFNHRLRQIAKQLGNQPDEGA